MNDGFTAMESISHVGDGGSLCPGALRRRLQWRNDGLPKLERYKAAIAAGCMGFLTSLTMVAAGTANVADPIRIPLHDGTSRLVGAAPFGEGGR